MNDEKSKEDNRKVNERLDEDREQRPRRKSNNMPDSYQGTGPQENTAAGYDPLENL